MLKNLKLEGFWLETMAPVLGRGKVGGSGLKPHSDKTHVAAIEGSFRPQGLELDWLVDWFLVVFLVTRRIEW